jgi:uncharacterized membrane protein
MTYAREFVTNAVVGGVLVLLPIYLSVLLLLKAMQAVAGLVRPLAALLPDRVPAENVLALVIVLIGCFVVGLAVRTRTGRVVRERMEMSFFGRLPGYALLRGLTQRLAGESNESAWKPALVEIEDALVPAFIIEVLDDGRFTVFVPSYRHRWPEPSTSSAGNACIPSISHSPRPSGPFPSGHQGPKTWWPR